MAKPSYTALLKDLKQLRKSKNFSYTDMAFLFNISGDGYRKMEDGSSPISVERLLQICEKLEHHPVDLLLGILNTKTSIEYQAEIKMLRHSVAELRIERDRLWNAMNKLVSLLAPEASDELHEMFRY